MQTPYVRNALQGFFILTYKIGRNRDYRKSFDILSNYAPRNQKPKNEFSARSLLSHNFCMLMSLLNPNVLMS